MVGRGEDTRRQTPAVQGTWLGGNADVERRGEPVRPVGPDRPFLLRDSGNYIAE